MMHLRKLNYFDTALMINWRNANAKFFPSQPDLTISSHATWFNETYLNDPADHMYVIEADEEDHHYGPIGTIGFNVRTREIGRVMRGVDAVPGIMGRALEEIVSLYSYGYYWLKVLADNDHAIRFYRKHCFFEGNHENGYIYMERDYV